MVMFPPPLLAVILCGEAEFSGSESLTVPPPVAAVTRY
jgi:hypothetical protein